MRYSEPMRVELEAGTDAATLLVFDPAALPPDYDRRRDHDPLELHEALAEQGRALLFETGADGIYRLHLYVDEPVPADVRAACQNPITVERFQIPSGRLYFTGAEYGFRRDDAFLRAYPQMGASAEVGAGA